MLIVGQSLGAVGSYDNPRIVLVFFLGGCTFAEISAFRFLAQQEEGKEPIVCLLQNSPNN